MDILKNSLEFHRPVTIIYMDKDSKITRRNIQVLGIKGESVEAFCYLRRQKRYFKKENILAAEYIH